MKDFFDRKTFDPINNEADKSTLNVLRQLGRRRQHNLIPSTAMSWVQPTEAELGSFVDLGCGDSPDWLIAKQMKFARGYRTDLFAPTSGTDDWTKADIVEDVPFIGNSIDVAVSQAVVDLIEPVAREKFYRNVHRVLKPGGHFYCFIQWLQPGWGFDLTEEQGRAIKVFGTIEKKTGGFIATKGA